MALQDISSYYNNMYKGDVWPVPVQIKRGNGLPLDQSTIFQTYEAALSYAQGNKVSSYSPEGKLLEQTAAYRGQFIAVVPLCGETSGYIVNNDSGLTPLATGGSADQILEKLNSEIQRAQAAEAEISGNLSTVSGDLGTLSTDFGTLTGTTLPALSGTLSGGLSVTVEKLAVAAEGFEATYVVKQGGLSVGDFINIPKDKVISGAYVVDVVGKWDETKTPAELSAFEVSYNAGEVKKTVVKSVEPDLFAVINNAYSGTGGGDGKYLRITVTNAEALPIYIALPELVDTYIGAETDTVSVSVNANTREISASVKDGSIGTAHLSADAVTNAKLADDAVQTENIKDSAVTTGKLADTAVTTAKIADAAITEVKLSADSVSTSKIQDSAVTTAKIADKNVTEGKIGDAAVTTRTIATNAVTETNISADSVSTVKIKDAAVTTAKIDVKAVTNDKIGDSAVSELQISANAVTTAKIKDAAVTTAKIENDAIDNSKIADSAVQTENIADTSITLAKLSSDVTNYIDTAASTAESNAKSYADAEIAKLSVATVYETKTDAAAKLAEAKTYTDTLSTATDGKISSARTDLSAYARETSANALTEAKAYAKSYTDTEIAKLSVADVYETKTDAAAKLAEAKTYTDTLSTATDGKISSARTDLSAYARETSAAALTEAKAYTDNEITALSSSLQTAIDNEITARQQAITGLSTELKGDVSTEKTAREGADSYISGKVDELSGSFKTVSADHETRLTAVEGKVAGLSTAMHFKGMATETALSTGWTGTPIPPYKTGDTPEAGDIVIRISDGKEFVWGSSQWNELGDEKGIYATKSALEAEEQRAKAAEQYISGKVDTVSADLDTLESSFATLTGTTLPLSVGNLQSAIADEISAREGADSYISGKVDSKIKTGTYANEAYDLSNSDLSVVKISDADYYALAAAEKADPKVIYIVSSDYVNGHDLRVINVGTAVSATDAVNLSGMNAAIDAAKQQIVANSLSGVTLNGVSATIANNVAVLSIDIIDCGGAN